MLSYYDRLERSASQINEKPFSWNAQIIWREQQDPGLTRRFQFGMIAAGQTQKALSGFPGKHEDGRLHERLISRRDENGAKPDAPRGPAQRP